MPDVSILVLDPPQKGTLSGLLEMARDMLGFSDDIEDIYGDARWSAWLNAARDDLIAEMDPTGRLIPSTAVAVTVTGAEAYDLLASGFLRIDRVEYAMDGGEPAPLPLYDERDAAPYLVPAAARRGRPSIAFRSGIGTLGFNDPPTGGALAVVGPTLPEDMAASEDTSGLPALFSETVCLGAALRACRHDIGRTENGMRLPLLDAEWREKVRRLRYLLKKMVPSRGGFVVAEGGVPWGRRSGDRGAR